ncbi:ABC transporter substrate-binding protein [Defluviimonas salinarum]|uniref:ABC transporter substrate-binding protein n=1 Tax=Defluviimonas salinarum TaxID=2992147 RepID=A0ABT3J7H3_9RHOB|nr:ABC transporter substrate-binding protein [Defluviimonas salinarum]MCW3783614.1 ABC transporter substrate-binding protein [Defluviimonas salinarum]
MKTTATVLGIAAASILSTASSAVAQSAEPVRIAVIDSTDGDFLTYTLGGVLKEAGINVEYVRVDYTALVPALETGDIDVVAAFWDTAGWHTLMDSVEAGAVVNFGTSGVRIKEGWWYPDYMTEVCPGLPDWTALQNEACVKALSTVETEPRGRYVDAPADWETDGQRRMDALQLNFEAISSGSPVTMVATVKGAVDNEEPILGWGFVPHWYFEQVPGGFVEFGEHDDACYEDAAWGPNPDATYDCGYSAGWLWKIGSKSFSDRDPKAARLVHLFQMQTAAVSNATGEVDVEGRDIEAVAQEWIETNRSMWSAWMN